MKNEQHIDKNKFKTPEGYFDDLENNILNKTIHAPRERPQIFNLMRPWMGLAAGLVFILAASFYLLKPETIGTADMTETQSYYVAELDQALYESLLFDTEEQENTLDELADFLIELEEL